MDVAEPAPIRSVLFIASSQRSGSSLLARYLAATGLFGVPLEYLSEGNFPQWRKRFAVKNYMDLLDAIEPLRTTPNGIFSIKGHYFQLRALGSVADLIRRYGDCRFVRIRRHDLVQQAVSRTIAVQTGVWISGQQSTREPVYDRGEIARNFRRISWQDSRWPIALSAAGVPWIEVVYESLVQDPAAEIRRIGELMDVATTSIDLPEAPPLSAQNPELTRQWADRFRSEDPDLNYAIADQVVERGGGFRSLVRALAPRIFSRRKPWRGSPNLIEVR